MGGEQAGREPVSGFFKGAPGVFIKGVEGGGFWEGVKDFDVKVAPPSYRQVNREIVE